MTRTILSCRETMQAIESLPQPFDPATWLVEQAGDAECTLLAHADDGVIWGKVQGGVLTTSHDAANGTAAASVSPPLREVTLQMARLFNDNGEIFIWRDADSLTWHGRMIYTPAEGEEAHFTEAIDEGYLLWGNRAEMLGESGFTLLSDAGQGLRHIVPLQVDASALPLRLRVRHLIALDDTGFARITATRLVTVEGK